MTNWESMATLIAGLPNLPDAACKQGVDLFEATIAERGQYGKAELEHARAAPLRTCGMCPALDPCRAWRAVLPRSHRPRGVVAGQVVNSTGHVRPSRDGTDVYETGQHER